MKEANLQKYYQADSSLRQYQQKNKEKIYKTWETCKSVMLQMPTGTGKTRLFVSIIKDIHHLAQEEGNAIKVLILVHRKELVDQIDEELSLRYGLAHGIIQAGDREHKHYPIQIASVQSLNRRLDNWIDKLFDYIIVDEAHHITAQSYQNIIKAFPEAKILGVTATPCRLNGEGFTNTFEHLIVSPPVRWFIENEYLSQYEYYSVARTSFIQKEINGIKKFSNGDYAEPEMARVCDNNRIRAQVIDTYIKFANGKKGIVYTINKTHNKNLCEEFISHGIRAVALDCDTPRNIREEYIENFKKGDIQILCNVNLFTEGFDCPDIEFVQLARPTKSLTLYLQQVGRGLRISDNKEKVLFLDNVGLYNKFGLPMARRHWRKHFEGKYEDADDENLDQDDISEYNDEEQKTRRWKHPNLKEGNEIVHLIESTEDSQLIYTRAEQLWDLLDEYNTLNVKACEEAIDMMYEAFSKPSKKVPHKPFDGAFISYYMKNGEYLNYYHLDFLEDSQFVKSHLEGKFGVMRYFCDEDGNEEKDMRAAANKDEIAICYDGTFNAFRIKILRTKLKEWKEKVEQCNFSEDELEDIIPRVLYKQFSTYPKANTNVPTNLQRLQFDMKEVLPKSGKVGKFVGLLDKVLFSSMMRTQGLGAAFSYMFKSLAHNMKWIKLTAEALGITEEVRYKEKLKDKKDVEELTPYSELNPIPREEAVLIPELNIEVTPLVMDAYEAFREVDDKRLDERLDELGPNYESGDPEADALLAKFYKELDECDKARERWMSTPSAEERNRAYIQALQMIENVQKYGIPSIHWDNTRK